MRNGRDNKNNAAIVAATLAAEPDVSGQQNINLKLKRQYQSYKRQEGEQSAEREWRWAE